MTRLSTTRRPVIRLPPTHPPASRLTANRRPVTRPPKMTRPKVTPPGGDPPVGDPLAGDRPAGDAGATEEIAGWLIGEARLLLAPLELVEGFCGRLLALGIPLARLRAGQAIANPLASAWGVIWARDGAGTHEYTVPRTMLATGAYHGSPFQHVIRTRQSFRRRLLDLDPERDHPVLHEMAAAGSTDYFALPLEYGDGSVQALSMVAEGAAGFADRHLQIIEALRQPLAAALEPTAMRRSSASLLRTYLGDGPAEAVLRGAIRRGDRRRIEAAILFSDLRGFTALSERLGEEALFAALDRYFEAVVEAVRAEQGDVLKFLGDGILAIFPVETAGSAAAACRAAVGAIGQAAGRLAAAPQADGTLLAFTATLARRRGRLRQHRQPRPARFHRARPGGQPRESPRGPGQGAGPAGALLGSLRPGARGTRPLARPLRAQGRRPGAGGVRRAGLRRPRGLTGRYARASGTKRNRACCRDEYRLATRSLVMIKVFSTALLAIAALGLAACGEQAKLPVSAGVGPDPELPAPEQSFMPTVNIAPAKGWANGGMPSAADGLAVAAFADGLDHPRWLYVLPNGDVLVAETNAPPKPEDGKGIKGWIMGLLMQRAGAGGPSANRITLLRDANGDGVVDSRSVFLDGLHSPFGMALVGNDFYVADTDALLRFPYQRRRDPDRGGGREGDRPARRADQPPLDQERDREPGRLQALRDGGLQQQRRRERHGGRGGTRRDLGGRSRRPASTGSSPRGCATRTASPGSPRPAPSGPWSTSATNSAAIWSRTT